MTCMMSQSVTWLCYENKTAEWIEVLLVVETLGDQWHVLLGSQSPYREWSSQLCKILPISSV